MEIFMIAFRQVAELFILIFCGAVCYKAGVVTDRSKKDFSGILINVVIPAVILYSFQHEMSMADGEKLLWAFLYCVLAHVLFILLGYVFLPGKGEHCRIERICVTYTNAGFMGIPLMSALFGSEGVFYAAVYVAVFHLFMWTHGVISLTGGTSLRTSLSQLLSPTIIAVALSVILFFLNIRIPDILLVPIGYLSDMNTPLAMVVTGVSLASYQLGKLFGNHRVYYVTLLRLAVFPALLLILFRLLGISGTAASCILVAGACPTGALAPMLALRYGADEQSASGVFALTTLLSLISIPVFMIFIQ